MSASLSPENSSRLLNGLRLAAVAGQLVVIAVAARLFGGALPIWPLLAVTAAFSLWHLLGVLQRRQGAALHPGRLTVEVLADVTAITAMLCLSGGWTNPFVSIYLVPVGFAATLLPVARALWVAGAAFAGYLLTIFVHVPLPAVTHGAASGFSLHLLGMWVSFVMAALVLVSCVLLVRRAMDQERQALAREREARLRDEQLLALGTLAASTAHELGTPLSTARMLVEAMEETGAAGPRELAAVAQQLDLVGATLHRLVRVADPQQEQDVDLQEFCARIADRFRTLRPDVELADSTLPRPGNVMRSNRLLESAVLSLLMNAATASARARRPTVRFAGQVRERSLRLRIRDYGDGFDAPAPPLPRRRDGRFSNGLGVGLVISSATIERYGGSARHYPRQPGTEVVVSLPLAALQASS